MKIVLCIYWMFLFVKNFEIGKWIEMGEDVILYLNIFIVVRLDIGGKKIYYYKK